jgi:hypothetical protein
MYSASVALSVLGLGFLAWAGLSIADKHAHTAVVLIAWALVTFSPILLFTWPAECRVIDTEGGPCQETAYGLLFGCTDYYHWWPKFFARLGLKKEALRGMQRHEPSGSYARMYQDALEQQPVRVIIENSRFNTCGTLAGIICAAVGVTQLVISFR